MSSFFRIIDLVVLLAVCGVDAMTSEISSKEYQFMMKNTHPVTEYKVHNEDVINSYGGSDLPIDWGIIKEEAIKGDPIAQYCHAIHCLALARKLFNGERIAKRKEGYVCMLISAIFGKFEDSRSAFTYVGDISFLDTKTSEAALLKLAEMFATR